MEIDTCLLDVLVLDGVVEQVHEISLPTARTTPDVDPLRSGKRLHSGGRAGVVDDRIVRPCVFHLGDVGGARGTFGGCHVARLGRTSEPTPGRGLLLCCRRWSGFWKHGVGRVGVVGD